MTLTPTDALGLLASGVFLVRLLPQPIRLARTGVAAGVSPLSALNSLLTMIAWVSYGLIVGLPLLWVVSAIALVPAVWTVLLLRRDVSRRDLTWAGVWLALQVVAAAVGLLVVVLAAGVLVTQGPQVVRAVRESDLTGLAAATWWLSLLDASTWGAYGVAVGDAAARWPTASCWPPRPASCSAASTSPGGRSSRSPPPPERGGRATVPGHGRRCRDLRRLGQPQARAGDRRLPRLPARVRARRCGSPRATSSSGCWRTCAAATSSSSRAPASRPTTTSWSCCSGSTRSSGPARRRSPRSSPTSATPRATRRTSPGSPSGPGCAPTPSRRPASTGCVTLDLHAPQVQGFFKVPVDDLYALPVLCDAIAAKALTDLVVVAPRCRLRQEGPAVVRPPAGAPGHRRQAPRRPLRDGRGHRADRLGRGSHGADRRRLHDLGRHPGRRGPGADRTRCGRRCTRP